MSCFQLFYLITGLYIDEGTLKEMKRWGYEIHSTFTAPGSVIDWKNILNFPGFAYMTF